MKTIRLIGVTLDALRTERPEDFRRLCAQLAGSCVAFEIDGDRLALSFSRTGFLTSIGTADVLVRSTTATIVDLIDARLSVSDALFADRLELYGASSRLAQVHEALTIWILGVVGCSASRHWCGVLRNKRETANE